MDMNIDDSGFIFLHRKFLRSWLWSNHELSRFWIWCLLKASWKPCKVAVGSSAVALQRGQFIFGRHQAAKETGLTERTIRTCIASLQSDKDDPEITIKATNKFSILTVVKYDLYQKSASKNDQQDSQQKNQQNDQQELIATGCSKRTSKNAGRKDDQQLDQQATSKRPASDHRQEVNKLNKTDDTARAESSVGSVGLFGQKEWNLMVVGMNLDARKFAFARAQVLSFDEIALWVQAHQRKASGAKILDPFACSQAWGKAGDQPPAEIVQSVKKYLDPAPRKGESCTVCHHGLVEEEYSPGSGRQISRCGYCGKVWHR